MAFRTNKYTLSIQDEGGGVATMRFEAGENPTYSRLEQLRNYMRDQTGGIIVSEGIIYGVETATQTFTEGHYDRVWQKLHVSVQDNNGVHRYSIPAPRETIFDTDQQALATWVADFLENMATFGVITRPFAFLGAYLGSKIGQKPRRTNVQ